MANETFIYQKRMYNPSWAISYIKSVAPDGVAELEITIYSDEIENQTHTHTFVYDGMLDPWFVTDFIEFHMLQQKINFNHSDYKQILDYFIDTRGFKKGR